MARRQSEMRLLAALVLVSILTACATQAGSSPLASPQATASANDPCAGGEVELAAVLEMSPEARIDCFGSRPITFRAFASGMVGVGTCDFTPVPGGGWLNVCGSPHRVLMLAPGDQEGLTAYLPPKFDPAEVPIETWVTVMGHFDDPAASTCDRDQPDGRANDPRAVEMCRLAFVLDSILASE